MDQAGPQMESIDIADNHMIGCERKTTIALHVGQTYVEYPKCTALMWQMPRKPKVPTQSEVHVAHYI